MSFLSEELALSFDMCSAKLCNSVYDNFDSSIPLVISESFSSVIPVSLNSPFDWFVSSIGLISHGDVANTVSKESLCKVIRDSCLWYASE